MYTVESKPVLPGRVLQISLLAGGQPPSFRQFFESLRDSPPARAGFNSLLAGVPFDAYRWELPALTKDVIERSFECVLIHAPLFERRRADPLAFSPHFDDASDIASFANLGGDALMIVPAPRAERAHYGHLASFVRGAPGQQCDALWSVTAREVLARVGDQPIWLNTAGGGVPWLHIRIDTRPKYYAYRPYARAGTQIPGDDL